MHEKPPYGMIAILFFGAFVAFLNNTLLNIALPVIMNEFEVKPSDVQWLTTGFMLVNGIMIPASAFFVQKFTNRRLFLTAMTLFSIGTALAIFAPTFGLLVTARMIQASGSALMMPLLMNVMLVAFPIERRGSAMGMFGLVMFTAPAIGPTLSGYIVEHYSWRTLFEIVLPFAILTLIFAFIKLKNITPNTDVKLDVFSLILSSIGFGGLLYGFSSAGDKGWDAPIVYGTIAIGAISLLTFIIRQLRMEVPMLDFRIYKYPMFALASVISIVLSVAMFSGMILTPLYVQEVRGISPFEAGILMLPGAIIMGLMSPITGRLFDKYGAKVLAITGLVITVITTFYLSRLELHSGYYYLMALYTVRMFGMSMVMMPIMTNGLNQLPMKSNPHGTAMNNTLQQVSGAIGSAILLTIMTKRMEKSGMSLAEEAATSGTIPSDQNALATFQQQIEMKAMLDGINFSFLIATIIATAALFLTLFIKRVRPPKFEQVATDDKIDTETVQD
ncbi:DHA2 family efflux MFS transporter permease subunit [Sporosarcina thermotolerans]|uniref:DHA2 family efflux MFS transporter permease subunit n=1 Tax=Sporosarcina thermotolerans TaxID=633404 RepID=A0AAW9ABG8_9BACL|nr:DHA2 family efflux MFS transporter permease subunit [Sporosarcina thermotolerans]MDW0118757.1 DHA2 family efflux MFS transporter permease subunit [Sporosarcina thermotolerans]